MFNIISVLILTNNYNYMKGGLMYRALKIPYLSVLSVFKIGGQRKMLAGFDRNLILVFYLRCYQRYSSQKEVNFGTSNVIQFWNIACPNH
jgi:hypothetical protein